VSRVYGNGEVSTDVDGWPDAVLITTGPVAVIKRGPTERTGALGDLGIYRRDFGVDFYVSGLDRAAAERWIDGLDDAMVTEFSSGLTLDGLVQSCLFMGSEEPESSADNDRPLIRWTCHIETRERLPRNTTP
jgi:hypothetical protein